MVPRGAIWVLMIFSLWVSTSLGLFVSQSDIAMLTHTVRTLTLTTTAECATWVLVFLGQQLSLYAHNDSTAAKAIC